MTDNAIRYDIDSEGIVTLTLDDPAQSANTMNEGFIVSLGAVVDRLVAERDSITGVILTSAKKTFFAGGDLNDILRSQRGEAEAVIANVNRIKAPMRRLETLGRPVVAAIGGAALGGGLELALVCHHRIAVNAASVAVGLPEVTLGLLPGGGGIVRTVRLLGVVTALTQVLLQGQRHSPDKALALGLVDELVEDADDLVPAAKRWIAANPGAEQPWDVKGYKIPGGTPATPALAANLPAFPANLRKQLKGAPYPAPIAIMSAAVEGAQVDFDTAQTIENRYFADLATGQISKNMIRAFFFDMQKANSLFKQYGGADREPVRKVVVLGAGMMGAAIAYVCARSGMDVVLKDVSLEAAQRGKGYSKNLLDKAVAKGRSTQEKADAILGRILPTDRPEEAEGAELVIEAVFEDPAVKNKVFAEIDEFIAPDALLCSNTSTLPITLLGAGVSRTEDFIGLHFFSPVDRMPLVEIIKGDKTSDDALGRALAVVQQIGKTPIVVNDSRGFFTSRVIGTFTNEGIAMLGEGISPASIEQATLQAGYPAPVLALMDELTLTLPRKIREETRSAAIAAGQEWVAHPADAVVDRMIDEFGRRGRSTGAGFYEYVDGKRAGLWSGLSAFGGTTVIPFGDMVERMLFIEAIETVRCLEEGVLDTATDANVGSILGIGYPGWTGGVARYIDQYPGGAQGFGERAHELAQRYGERFAPPQLLLDKAAAGGTFEEGN
ncbi:3-hydroxyacyl-CoA dehydrogenase NAD-binding domain-containing protein [Rhodococcus maanshanensis]|uniref:3-hydroxyacyl-CoA dehydrogenase / enoyl-CoA hydratase / 3-hydroxybutyryl-CoA epimerase n=1 Tax=Rhodococcus maanshanensis TaxID=183556 RepID=A0A1H7KVZ9_9NOCA|nr:3-hydroxyacyl-CoA dehydrogenase NAD-binding domain-containing protein [Rhodococcus maanshanensis]SEK90666.1 3-hydroxyacyl-CoA dehydrogenase / enoyl-CoA hydratase / 3-hydroxybutyryl-CoA epimerase [Rhodococcus maanshanensis]